MSLRRRWLNVKAVLALCGILVLVGATPNDTSFRFSDIAGVTVALADDDDGGGDDGGGSSRGSRSGGDGSSFRSGGSGIFRFLRERTAPRAQRPRRVQTAVPPPPVRADNEIVGLGFTDPQLDQLNASGFEVLQRDAIATFNADVIKFRIPSGLTAEAARQQVALVAPQAVIDFNHYYRPEQHPDQPCRGKDCMARHLIGWPVNPLGSASCGESVRIGLIDTAINSEHPAFESGSIEIIRLTGEALPESGRQHGTAVAALLVGSANSRTPGLVPGGTLIAVDAFSRARRQDDRSEAYDLVRAVDLLVQRNVHVINMSLAGPPNVLLEQAVKKLANKQIILVAAAGNNGPNAKPVYPAAYDTVIAVTAIDRRKQPYRRAGRGAHIDLAAPGVNVWTAASIEGARPKTGTSFAAPFVTAAAALMKAGKADTTASEVTDALAKSAEDLGTPGKDPVFGWGMLDARALCALQTD